MLALVFAPSVLAQASRPTEIPPDQIDPTRHIAAPQLELKTHKPLLEEYIWTQENAGKSAWLMSYENVKQTDMTEPHYFRRVFTLSALPSAATLYVAGPRSVRIYVNGEMVNQVESNLDSPFPVRVFATEVTHALRKGKNAIAIEAVRGSGINGYDNSGLIMQISLGKILGVKLVNGAKGVDGPALLVSNQDWKASIKSAVGWEETGFNDGSWKAADSLGSIEGSINLFQWDADAGMYDWPGYDGISPFLAQAPLQPTSVGHVYGGIGTVENADALTSSASSRNEFTVELPSSRAEGEDAPQILLDFGRNANGRLHFVSDSDGPAEVTVQYGESDTEALNEPYLGFDRLYIGPHSSAYGPKSAFRYAIVRFVGSSQKLRFKSINLDLIYYPVNYKGSFESSDPKLNLMWAIGAYTAHLCMQDGIWDAPKRDRARYAGDFDVSGRAISDIFGDRFLMEDTLDRLMGPAPVRQHVNATAGYSALWIIDEAEYYRHTGSNQQLMSFHDRLIQLMQLMEKDLDDRSLYANCTKTRPFVDWSPELVGDTAEARRGTQMEFYGAFEQGVYLLDEMGDTQNAKLFGQRAAQLKAAAQQYLLDKQTNSYGGRWQINAMAVLSGIADPSQYDTIWEASLASVGKIKYNALIITPYYNYYVISAMARMGHRAEALDWIRQYWGGMVDEGATSFWESYDPAWYKDDPHGSLQADNGSGYRVSLAHGWSSGVTPWLMEEVLGIHSTGAGFSTVDIRPDLIGLAWAKGGEPTPRGMLNVSINKAETGTNIGLDLPAGTEARVSIPVELSDASGQVVVNGKPEISISAENSTRAIVVLNQPGHYEIAMAHERL